MGRWRNRRDHELAQRRISEYLDGDLGERWRRRIARHVDACPECGPMLRGLVRIRVVLRAFGRPPGAEHTIVPRVLEQVRAEEPPARSSSPAKDGRP